MMWPGDGPWPASAAGPVTAAALLAAAVIIVRLFFVPRLQPSSGTKRRGPESGASGSARLPAGSLGWPLLGETPAFILAAYSARPESFVERRRLLYGKVFASHLWGSPAVVSSDPEVSRAVLQADASAFVPWYPRSLMELMGRSSILVLGGGLQRRVHGLAGAFFKSPHLKARVTADMHRRVARAMAAWPGAAPVVRVQDEAKSVRDATRCEPPPPPSLSPASLSVSLTTTTIADRSIRVLASWCPYYIHVCRWARARVRAPMSLP
jgi:steroid 3-oxidase